MKKWFPKGRGSKPRQLKDAYKLPTLAFTRRISLSIEGGKVQSSRVEKQVTLPIVIEH